MHVLLRSKSLHKAVLIEQYGPGNSSTFGIILDICCSGGLACIDMLPVMLLPIPLLLEAILFLMSIIICILGLEHELSACTGHIPHMHFIMTSLFNGTFCSSFFLLNILKTFTSETQHLALHRCAEGLIREYVTVKQQQQKRSFAVVLLPLEITGQFFPRF